MGQKPVPWGIAKEVGVIDMCSSYFFSWREDESQSLSPNHSTLHQEEGVRQMPALFFQTAQLKPEETADKSLQV